MHPKRPYTDRPQTHGCLPQVCQGAWLLCLLPLWVWAAPVLEQVAFTARLVSDGPPHLKNQSSGTLDATLSPATGQLRWCVTHTNLPGGVTAIQLGTGHVNVASSTGPLDSPIVGNAQLTPEQATSLLAGKWRITLASPASDASGHIRTRP